MINTIKDTLTFASLAIFTLLTFSMVLSLAIQQTLITLEKNNKPAVVTTVKERAPTLGKNIQKDLAAKGIKVTVRSSY